MTFGFIELNNPLLTSILLIILLLVFCYVIFSVFYSKKSASVYDEIYREFQDRYFTLKVLVKLLLLFSIGILIIFIISGVKCSGKSPSLIAKNPDLAFIIDGSYSMYSDDIHKGSSRFDLAKTLTYDIVRNTTNNNTSLYLFSQKSYRYIPSNSDKESTLKMISDLDIKKIQTNSEWLSGSALGDSILHASGDFSSENKPTLIIISDGGVTDGISVKQALEYKSNNFSKVYYISIGSDNAHYTYVPTGNFGIGQKVLIDARDDRLKDLFGENFYIFDSLDFIREFEDLIKNQKINIYNNSKINNTTIKPFIYLLIILSSILVFLIIIEKYHGNYRLSFMLSLIFLIFLSSLLFLQGRIKDKIGIYYIDTETNKETLIEFLKNSNSDDTLMPIGFYDSEGKSKIAFPEGVNKDLVIREIDKIPTHNSNLDDKNNNNDKLPDNKTDFKYIKILLLCTWIFSLIVFVIRYEGKK